MARAIQIAGVDVRASVGSTTPLLLAKQRSGKDQHRLQKLNKHAFQHSSRAISVWHLNKHQYNPCPNIQLAQKNDSIIVVSFSLFLLCCDTEKTGAAQT
jgi:hypothetical protein